MRQVAGKRTLQPCRAAKILTTAVLVLSGATLAATRPSPVGPQPGAEESSSPYRLPQQVVSCGGDR